MTRYNDVESDFDQSLRGELRPFSIRDEFGLAGAENPIAHSDYGKLREILTRRIEELLHEDFNRLTSALYQMDIDEEKVQAALRLPSFGKCALSLADAIIEREIEKALFRHKTAEENF